VKRSCSDGLSGYIPLGYTFDVWEPQGEMKGYKGVIDLVTLCDPSVISEEAGFGPLRGRIVEGGKQLFGMYLGCSASRCVWHLFQGRSRRRIVLIVLSGTSVLLVPRHHSMYSRHSMNCGTMETRLFHLAEGRG
jgi:hypothetical protein